MEIRYNLTGEDRKKLVNTIGKILETAPKYLGVPSFSYESGDYIVDKNGTLTLGLC